MTPAELAKEIKSRATGAGRFLVALAGPPASGKSTLAVELATLLQPGAKVVPMDGFHYDDAVLEARGLRARKGAPETFDAAGFEHLLKRLRSEDEVAIPLFDRDLEISRAGAAIVTASDQILIVEGNYLLLNEAPWSGLAPLFDLTVFVQTDETVLRERLIDRWHHHGRDDAEALHWIESNDLPNIRRVLEGSKEIGRAHV